MTPQGHLRRTPRRRAIMAEDVTAIIAADLPWVALDGATVVVSGAAGFLAGYLVDALLALRPAYGFGPARVIGLVRSPANANVRFADHLHRPELGIVAADICFPVTIDGRVDFVIHAASPASPRTYLTAPTAVIHANVDGTRHLLDLAHANNARFLLFSSGEVYGETATVPTGEGDYGCIDPMAVRSCYAESKRLAETMVAAAAHQSGIHATVVRPFHTYGPGVALNDGRVFADFVSDIVGGRDIVLRSDGTDRRAFCYVADATAGFLTVMLKGLAATAYNVGNDDAEISIGDLANRLVAMFPDRGLKVVSDRSPRGNAYAPSPISRNVPATDRIRALGWHPTTTIDAGFRRMVASYE